MADEIVVEGLRVDAVIGVYPHERRIHQRLIIDLRVETDIRPVAATDDIHRAIDYDRLAEIVREAVTEKPHWLLETVSETIAGRLLAAFSGQITRVHLRVSKPAARTDAANVAIQISRP